MQEDLIRQIRKGKQQAVREVYQHFFHPLSAFAFKYVRNVRVQMEIQAGEKNLGKH